jgi:hypothetical protein
MAFDLQIVFTGLVFFCTPGNSNCLGYEANIHRGAAYLVNALADRKVCTYPMTGGHEPLLRISKNRIDPPPNDPICADDSDFVCQRLQGIALCVVLTDADGKELAPVQPRLRHYGSRTARHPQWQYRDFNNYRWLAGVTAVEPRADNLCWDEMNGEIGDDKLVIGRVILDRGILSTDVLKRRWSDWGPYVIWDLSRDLDPAEEFPRALPSQVRWRIPDIPADHKVHLRDCKANRNLYTLKSGRDISIEVSNLPRHPDVTGEGHLIHFRWFYTLVDWVPGYSCAVEHDRCPWDATLPGLPSSLNPALWLDLTTSESVHCPPAGTGSS